ncbi:MAG: hypothetical protein Q7J59_05760 [Elusimicrobiota bacterium]|nr:hypothetical protein [Elusimicrobiota bacterium]
MNKNNEKKKKEPGFIEKSDIEKIIGNDEVVEWYKLTPAERFAESQRLREIFILFGGSYDDGVDTQSPFNIFKT